MEYEIIYGKRRNKMKSCQLLYLPSEKCIFVKNNERYGKKEYHCYQRVLAANKKNDNSHLKCNARAYIDSENVCTRNGTNHSEHESHDKIVYSFEKMNRIKEVCETVGAVLPAHKVSTKQIFSTEIAG